jgi:PHD/YefM family antitoxin component YafN of YafNO toxin-antitoxin module
MTKSMGMIDARKRLTSLPEEFAQAPELGAVAVTRRGKPVLAVLSWDLYESLLETMEVMGDPELMKALRRGAQDIAAGRLATSDEVRRDLGL